MKKLLVILFGVGYFTSPVAGQDRVDSYTRSKQHAIHYMRPAPDFFEGAILGNGGMGVIVTTRPDGVVFYFGHNNIWDIRLDESNKEKIGTFQEIFKKVKAIPDTAKLLTDNPWYNEYQKMAQSSYRKPYPRPYPCGSVLLGFDRRNAEMVGHKLDISQGLCEVYLLTKEKQKIVLQVFADMLADRLWFRLVDERGNACENIFDRIRVIPDPSTPKEFPRLSAEENFEKGLLSFRQTMPYAEPAVYDVDKKHPKDRAFRLLASVNTTLEKTTRINWNGNQQEMAQMEAAITKKSGWVGMISLQEDLDRVLEIKQPMQRLPKNEELVSVLNQNREIWKSYWNKSGIILQDKLLEQIWYRNLYFLNCAAKAEATPPGLFANWSYNSIGTSWHGDYHMNYNTQQPYWVTFSSNHLEKNLPYVNLIEKLIPVSKRWAAEYYQLPGAYFPHSAYPVEMTMNPYPVPTWGWEICETPWSVQGLWWHYLYSADIDFLKNRAYEPIKLAVEFLVAYMMRPEASGTEWKDNKFHIFPTVPPELYGLRPGFAYNYDCNVDLTLTKFIFKAFIEATRLLKWEQRESGLLSKVQLILSRFPEYPTAVSKKYGKVLVSAPGEHANVVYNTPNPLMSVFPGEDLGRHSDTATQRLLKNTYLNQQNEGGNDLVFINLQAARIGMLDIEKFKRQVSYSTLPNGACTDRVMQVHGRYSDATEYGYMDKKGIWFENFSLPVVINECLMQSYDGIIQLFPNWPMHQDARFTNLRAVGAFLVSAALQNGKVTAIKITSEAGGTLKMYLPWPKGGRVSRKGGVSTRYSSYVEMPTQKGETLVFMP
ncbi:MAG: hypothetical protein FGM61_01435 [Sediminibacterium sp.]|nr:hypothetical protein [Sediminibacterium sp.]